LPSLHKVAERLDDDEKGRSLIPTLGGNQETRNSPITPNYSSFGGGVDDNPLINAKNRINTGLSGLPQTKATFGGDESGATSGGDGFIEIASDDSRYKDNPFLDERIERVALNWGTPLISILMSNGPALQGLYDARSPSLV
jgi:hypothetical protein